MLSLYIIKLLVCQSITIQMRIDYSRWEELGKPASGPFGVWTVISGKAHSKEQTVQNE